MFFPIYSHIYHCIHISLLFSQFLHVVTLFLSVFLCSRFSSLHLMFLHTAKYDTFSSSTNRPSTSLSSSRYFFPFQASYPTLLHIKSVLSSVCISLCTVFTGLLMLSHRISALLLTLFPMFCLCIGTTGICTFSKPSTLFQTCLVQSKVCYVSPLATKYPHLLTFAIVSDSHLQIFYKLYIYIYMRTSLCVYDI